jgi:hypothetical protein
LKRTQNQDQNLNQVKNLILKSSSALEKNLQMLIPAGGVRMDLTKKDQWLCQGSRVNASYQQMENYQK